MNFPRSDGHAKRTILDPVKRSASIRLTRVQACALSFSEAKRYPREFFPLDTWFINFITQSSEIFLLGFFFFSIFWLGRFDWDFNNLGNLILFVNYYWSVILNFFNAILYRFKFYTISLGLLCITILNVIENNDANYIIIVIYLQKLIDVNEIYISILPFYFYSFVWIWIVCIYG